jgi:AcrR family transcriptional regulator
MPEGDVARRILESSRRLLAEKGWNGLTVSAICAEAGVYRAAVNYHFGSKEGLAAVLLESLVHEAAHRLMTNVRRIPPNEVRIRETAKGFDMLGGRDLQVAFFEAFAHLIRDPDLRLHLERLYEDANGIAAVAMSGGQPDKVPALYPYAVMLVAFVDGVIIQQLASPEKDFGAIIDAFSSMLAPIVAELVNSHPRADSDEKGMADLSESVELVEQT